MCGYLLERVMKVVMFFAKNNFQKIVSQEPPAYLYDILHIFNQESPDYENFEKSSEL